MIVPAQAVGLTGGRCTVAGAQFTAAHGLEAIGSRLSNERYLWRNLWPSVGGMR